MLEVNDDTFLTIGREGIFVESATFVNRKFSHNPVAVKNHTVIPRFGFLVAM